LAGQEKVGNMGMSFPGNQTCSRKIFRSNTINFVNFYGVNKKSTLGANRPRAQDATLLSFRKSSRLIQSALPPWQVTK